jgi:hypothetical protein
MEDTALMRKLLKDCVQIIDDWDLVNGAQPIESLKHMIETLAQSAHVVGINPNELRSLRDMLGDDFAIRMEKKK